MSGIDRTFPLNWSKAKDGLYWREWAAVKRKDSRVDRHGLHIRALGHDKSHVDLTNKEFDKVLAEFRAISRPADLIAQLDAMNGRKKRTIFGIRRTAAKMKVGPEYVATIVESQTGRKSDLYLLTEDQLEKVRIAMALQFRREKAAEKRELQEVMA